MRKLKYTLSRSALNQIYLYYLLPITEYSSYVWDGCTQQDSDTKRNSPYFNGTHWLSYITSAAGLTNQ